MRFHRMITACLLGVAMSLTTGCVTDDDGELTEEEILAAEEEEDPIDDEPSEYEYEEEEEEYEEDPEEYTEEEEWNGIDPDILEEEAEVESQELLADELAEDVIDGTLDDDPMIDETIDDTEWVDVTQPALPQEAEVLTATQGDLTLTCSPTGSQDMVMLTTRYGCKAFIKQTGEYYGVIKGWWQVTRSDGTRIRIKDLVFRDGECDATLSVPNNDALAGVKARPWR